MISIGYVNKLLFAKVASILNKQYFSVWSVVRPLCLGGTEISSADKSDNISVFDPAFIIFFS
jgi:hypothetical protein